MTGDEERRWERYSEGTLIGPLPHRLVRGRWLPQWDAPGVRERKNAEIDFVEDMCHVKGRD